MATIDTNGALHDAEGKYAHQHKPEAGYDLYLGFAEEHNNVSRQDRYKFGAGLAIGGLAIGGLAACTHEEAPSAAGAGEPSISVTTPSATVDPTETAPVEVTPAPPAVGQVLTYEEAKAPGAPPTYRTKDSEYIVISPDEPLPQSVQDDMATANTLSSWDSAREQLRSPGIYGVFIVRQDIPGIGSRFLVRLATKTQSTPSNQAPWIPAMSANNQGFDTAAEAVAFAKSLQEQYPELGAAELYDLTD